MMISNVLSIGGSVSDLYKFAEDLFHLTSQNKILLIKTDTDIADFTKPFKGKLLILGVKSSISVDISDTSDAINVYQQIIQIFPEQQVTVIFWNVKEIFSYFRYRLPTHVKISVLPKSVDLRLVESFLDIKLAPPKNLSEAMKRLTPYTQNDKCRNVHNLIHKPLAFVVLPEIETSKNLIDMNSLSYVHTSYVIEGQAFGRLNCHKSFDNCITPYNLSPEKRSNLKLPREKDCFINFDFRHMEPTVLQWLSGDINLKKVIEEFDDIYKGLYNLLFNKPCDTESKREYVKNLFLPIMFGLQPNTIVKEHNLSYADAEEIHTKIRTTFKSAWDFLDSKQGNSAVDFFGRPRYFDKPWVVRGFLVQATSAMVCQEKLIDLREIKQSRLLYSVHDGYFLVANQENLSSVILEGVKLLQKESKMCQGLKLRVACSVGKNLTLMKKITIPKGG